MDYESQKMFSHKIKTAAEIARLIGDRPRSQKVIMCHGTFDVVHPGHVRHLLYAKTKASILIASLTTDEHIKKGNLRPYVPENLRAVNLAALEMVDYVLVDADPTPLENLKLIKPDYFAKGYEYTAGTVNPKTKEEMAVLESYGGEVIFTPGDIVYSSSALIDLAPPTIGVDKLIALMDSEKLNFNDLRTALGKLKGLKVHVVGDTIVDSFTYCHLIGGMTKTPTMSVLFEKKVDYVGGAGVVAKHIRAAGANVTFTTVLGQDALQELVLKDLDAAGIQCTSIIDSTRPTTNKNAIIADTYRLLKVDTLDNRSISDKILEQIQHHIKTVSTDAVVFSDFRHGIFNRTTAPILCASIPKEVFKVADSQVASRWGNILEFQGFDLITPNEKEARFSLGDQDSVVRPLALELFRKSHAKLLILKCGDRGIVTYRMDSPDDYRAFFVVDSFAGKVVDAVGAGDALLAYATLSMIATKNEVIAAILGNMAAGIECEHEGNIPITPEMVLHKIDAVEKIARYGS
jgi:rfaE bifunctional protein kinase chain/domain